MIIEKKFLICCIRERIFENYKIVSNNVMHVQLDESLNLRFEVHMFKTCGRFTITSDIFLYNENVFIKILDSNNFFPFIKNHMFENGNSNGNENSIIANQNLFSELEASSRNAKILRKTKLHASKFMNSIDYVQNMLIHENFSPLVFYEQSVLEGHPTHPNAKTRLEFSKSDLLKYSPECRVQIPLKICAIRKEFIREYNNSEQSVSNLILNYDPKISQQIIDDFKLKQLDLENYDLILIHPWQFKNIVKKQYAFLLKNKSLVEINAHIQSAPLISLRSLALYGTEAGLRLHIKMALSVLTTSDVRVLSSLAVESGVKISRIFSFLQDKVNQKYNLNFYVVPEFAGIAIDLSSSFALNEEFPNRILDRLSFLFRPDIENFISKNEIALPCAALIEKSPFSDCKIIEEFIAVYKQGPLNFFQDYVALVLPGFLIYLTKYGLSLEGHLQNVVVSFENGKPSKVFVRDLSDIKISKKRLLMQNLGCDLSILNVNHPCLFYEELNSLHLNVFYSLIQAHFADLIMQLSSIYKIQENILWDTVKRKAEEVFALLKSEKNLEHSIAEDRSALLHAQQIVLKSTLKMRIKSSILNFEYGYVENPLYNKILACAPIAHMQEP